MNLFRSLTNGLRSRGIVLWPAAIILSTVITCKAVQFQVAVPSQMAFVDLDGKVKLLRHVPASIFGPRISPSGKEVAYRDGGSVWIADLFSEKPARQLTKEP